MMEHYSKINGRGHNGEVDGSLYLSFYCTPTYTDIYFCFQIVREINVNSGVNHYFFYKLNNLHIQLNEVFHQRSVRFEIEVALHDGCVF